MIISPKQFLILSIKTTGITLKNKEGALELYYPNGMISQKVEYKDAKEGWSIAKIGNEYLWTNTPTPGFSNKESVNLPSDIAPEKITSDKPSLEYIINSPKPPLPQGSKGVSDAPLPPTQESPESKKEALEQTKEKAEISLTASLGEQSSQTEINLWLILIGILVFSFLAGWGLIRIKNKT